MPNGDHSGIRKLMSDTMSSLSAHQKHDPAPPQPDEPLTGLGESDDGQVRASAVSPGRVQDLYIENRLVRQGGELVAEGVKQAVNKALEDLQNQASEAVQPVDTESLQEQLNEVQENALSQLQTMTNSLADAQARLVDQGRRK